MERLRNLAIATVLGIACTAAFTAHAQQNSAVPANDPAANAENPQASTQAQLPSVEQQMKILTDKLDLTPDQQAKVRPILQRLHDSMEKVVQDPSLSHEERVERVKPAHYKAHDEILQLLNDDQKQKLEDYMRGPHPEMHGNLGGNSSAQ